MVNLLVTGYQRILENLELGYEHVMYMYKYFVSVSTNTD